MHNGLKEKSANHYHKIRLSHIKSHDADFLFRKKHQDHISKKVAIKSHDAGTPRIHAADIFTLHFIQALITRGTLCFYNWS